MEHRSGLALYCISGFFQQCDQRGASRLGGCEIHRSLYLRKHGARCEVAFLNILLRLFDRDVAEPFFIRLAEVQGNLFYGREDDQLIRIQLLCDQAACKVLVYYGAGAF